jgi:HAD superfamily hydrolase (TIGR01662 family)
MKSESIDCLIFDIGGTINGPSFDGVDFLRYFLEEADLANASRLSSQRLGEAQEKASSWLNDYMIENNVPPKWKMTFSEQIRYSRIILESLEVDEPAERLATAYDKKLEFAVEELGAVMAEGCKSVLETLSTRGYHLGIASNRFGDPSGYFRRHRLESFFEAIQYSLVPGYRKPSPYMLLEVAEELSINPLKCAYVGDTIKYDIKAAKVAGMLPILTTEFQQSSDGFHSDEWLTVSNLSDLITIFQSGK